MRSMIERKLSGGFQRRRESSWKGRGGKGRDEKGWEGVGGEE